MPVDTGLMGVVLAFSAAAALVAAIQAFITGAAAHHDMAAYITGRGITLHALGGCTECVQSAFRLHRLAGPLVLGRLRGNAAG